MKALVIIPARYGSTRFPGKPLAIIHGKSMIQRVYEQAQQVVPDVWVATDDARIEHEVKRFGGKAIITSVEHQSGTDRLAEALSSIPGALKYSVVVNVQGDEPFIAAEQIQQLIQLFKQPDTQIATLIKPITNTEDLMNPNKPKVVIGTNMQALYFSRSPIPFVRDADKIYWHIAHQYYKHIGIYAYRPQILLDITKLERSSLEIAENLEQLRWLQNNYVIKTAITEYESASVDTPDDLEKILNKRF
ncbi:MAG TPA: 3-deoxy-manno-octulosonate cytidylyltransferase [Bacteroidales bacterium]|jgi:3-deoxy-manno-octulosonate cytidylyltransferase (CMP-KDO synthetase)|nr:3-deoxy-manno-octulosonate cytidylyltransferase [Bacteroidales bacterium]HRS17911.1 3-deoxy-manno-octulosonate cytidylyltransferase [Bacteroidales bacterium]